MLKVKMFEFRAILKKKINLVPLFCFHGNELKIIENIKGKMVEGTVLNIEKNNNFKKGEMGLKKIEEIDETNSKTSETIVADSNGNLKLKEDDEERKIVKMKDLNESLKGKYRPKSADSVGRVSFIENNLKKRARSSSALSGRLKKGGGRRPKSAGGDMFEVRERGSKGPHWKDVRTGSYKSLMADDNFRFSRCSSACGSCCCRSGRDQWISYYDEYLGSRYLVRKCRSNPSFSRAALDKYQKDFQKYRRSLKLLGFELSDFGIYGGTQNSSRQKSKRCSSSFSTRITSTSISLDSLRHSIRKAWVYDSLDNSHRRLLAQAAYEQWYFKKEAELLKKREEEKMRKLELKESLEKEFVKKKEKAEEEFRKWSKRKKIQRKDVENSEQKSVRIFSRLTKTKEESEKAFLKWKKEKDKELEKKMKEKRKEEEQKKENERQKREKKIEAEKAFQQWMLKFEEAQKTQAGKRLKPNKRKEEMERLKQRKEDSQVSFEMWKNAKDEEMKQKMREQREALRLAKEERLALMEERMYEAEQAFEEWLERVDTRHRQFAAIMSYRKKVPWLPV